MRARLLLLAAGLLAYGASLGSGFHFDDYAIFSHPLLPAGREWLSSGVLTRLTFWLNEQAGGGALLCHVVNFGLHLAAVLLLFECLKRMAGEQAAWIAAAIFAVHPLQAEAVNYVSARGELIAAVLVLAALHVWWRKGWEERAPAALPWVLAVVFAVSAFLADTEWALPATAAGRTSHFWTVGGVAAWRYLRLMILPWGFTVDPDVRQPAAWLEWSASLPLTLGAVMLWSWRKKPAARWAFTGVLLVAAAFLFPGRDLAPDYRMYVPMIAFCAAAGILLERVKPREIAIGVVVLLTVLGGARTWVWLSDERLWREAVRRAPDKARPKIQLAHAVRAAEALELLGEARELDPHDPEVPAAMGKVLLDEGQADGALTEFARALGMNPRDAVTLNNRGVALAELGHTDAARADFQKAIEIDPTLTEARENLNKLPGQ
jgi:protein O-mannosyl-transferase